MQIEAILASLFPQVFIFSAWKYFIMTIILTPRPPSMTIIPYANSLDPDETASIFQSHPDPSCLTLNHFHNFLAISKHLEY